MAKELATNPFCRPNSAGLRAAVDLPADAEDVEARGYGPGCLSACGGGLLERFFSFSLYSTRKRLWGLIEVEGVCMCMYHPNEVE